MSLTIAFSGKFIQLDFDSSGKMLGSKCQALLLEKVSEPF